ncbi:MAG: flagellar basal body P-ring protein FlgI [Planctomycetia bacterium]|nr:flagellar basal body P-ring protein FlgI [Planctomycetia bacterium]
MKSRCALFVVLVGLIGCFDPQTRLQSGDDTDRDKEPQVQQIGDVTSVANAEPIAVSGVGLVVDLEGTGAPALPGGFRSLLERDLKTEGHENVKEILSSPNHAMVLVSAMIPPGARQGDALDVEITLPPGSKVQSLRGGQLLKTVLYNYSSSHQVAPNTSRPDYALRGHKLAVAEGTLLVGFGDGAEEARVKQARIWGGARSAIDRPFYLALNPDQQFARVSMKIAERINETFNGPYQGPNSVLADAKTKEIVYLRVPEQYRHNLARYLRVVRAIPLVETPPPTGPYRKKLEEDLLDPAKTVTAALRLEALGTDSVPVLKKGLQCEHALVRFTSAEALAYLGSASCGEELTRLAVAEPMLRAYCLTALASLDEAVCHIKLRELFEAESPELRYGAFRALRTLDERDDSVQGEFLNEAFWLHQTAPQASPLVHVSTSKRPEIVIFGEEASLQPPFSFRVDPEFTVTAADDDERCTISRFSVKYGVKRRQCSLKLPDVLRNLAELGGVYPDAIELVRQAGRHKCLSCPVAVDALPEAPTVQQLARAGKGQADTGGSPEILNARSEFGATPNLFSRATGKPVRPVFE